MAAINLSEVSTSELIDELRLRGQGQAEPVEAGSAGTGRIAPDIKELDEAWACAHRNL